jgi:hypothetical protein
VRGSSIAPSSTRLARGTPTAREATTILLDDAAGDLVKIHGRDYVQRAGAKGVYIRAAEPG